METGEPMIVVCVSMAVPRNNSTLQRVPAAPVWENSDNPPKGSPGGGVRPFPNRSDRRYVLEQERRVPTNPRCRDGRSSDQAARFRDAGCPVRPAHMAA